MKKSRFTDSQMALILRQAEEGTSEEEVCRTAGISAKTYSPWRKKGGGIMPSELKRLKCLLSNLALGKEKLQNMIRRKS